MAMGDDKVRLLRSVTKRRYGLVYSNPHDS